MSTWSDVKKHMVLQALKTAAREYGGHLTHEGRDWSRCLQCRIGRTIADLESGIILMPEYR